MCLQCAKIFLSKHTICARRVFVYHNVLYVGVLVLDGVVDALGYAVRVRKRHAAVDAYLSVDIHLAAELARAQRVKAHYAVLRADEVAKALLIAVAAGSVEHLVGSVLQNVIGDLEDAQAYRDAGDRLQHRHSEPTDESASERWCHASAM